MLDRILARERGVRSRMSNLGHHAERDTRLGAYIVAWASASSFAAWRNPPVPLRTGSR